MKKLFEISSNELIEVQKIVKGLDKNRYQSIPNFMIDLVEKTVTITDGYICLRRKLETLEIWDLSNRYIHYGIKEFQSLKLRKNVGITFSVEEETVRKNKESFYNMKILCDVIELSSSLVMCGYHFPDCNRIIDKLKSDKIFYFNTKMLIETLNDMKSKCDEVGKYVFKDSILEVSIQNHLMKLTIKDFNLNNEPCEITKKIPVDYESSEIVEFKITTSKLLNYVKAQKYSVVEVSLGHCTYGNFYNTSFLNNEFVIMLIRP
jgi:hypothetical protein